MFEIEGVVIETGTIGPTSEKKDKPKESEWLIYEL